MSTRGLKPSPYRVFLHESGRHPIYWNTLKLGEAIFTRKERRPRRPGRILHSALWAVHSRPPVPF